MKMPITALCALTLLTAGLHNILAKDYTFSKDKEITDYLRILAIQSKEGGADVLSIGSDGTLDFVKETSLAVFAPQGADCQTSAEEVAIDFQVEGRMSFAVFLRAQAEDAESYMAIINSSGNWFHLCKTALSVNQNPKETTIVSMAAKQSFQAGENYRLRIRLKNEGPLVRISGELLNEGTGETLASLTADDSSAPITNPGLVAFRFYADPNYGDGAIRIKKVTVLPDATAKDL